MVSAADDAPTIAISGTMYAGFTGTTWGRATTKNGNCDQALSTAVGTQEIKCGGTAEGLLPEDDQGPKNLLRTKGCGRDEAVKGGLCVHSA